MIFKLSTAFVLLAALAQVKAAPTLISRHEGHDDSASAGTSSSDLVKKNALEAQQHNARFATIKETDACQGSEMACVEGAFASCVNGKWSAQKCNTGTQCFALPLVLKAGTSLACDTNADANLRFTDAGVTGGITGSSAAGDAEDIPDCEEEEDETTTATPTASIAPRDEVHFFDRRQASTIVADFPSPSTTTISSVSSSATSTSTSTSAAPVVTPTVVIGSDGIVTVTIVSTATVTVSATDCAATGTSSTVPVITSSSTRAPLTVGSATPTPSASSTLASVSTSSVVGSTTAASTSASPSASVILLTSSPATGTGSPSSSFSFSVRPTQSA